MTFLLVKQLESEGNRKNVINFRNFSGYNCKYIVKSEHSFLINFVKNIVSKNKLSI